MAALVGRFGTSGTSGFLAPDALGTLLFLGNRWGICQLQMALHMTLATLAAPIAWVGA